MRTFTLYGLDRTGAVAATEEIKAIKPEAAVEIARKRLREFDRIELWEGTVLVLRQGQANRDR